MGSTLLGEVFRKGILYEIPDKDDTNNYKCFKAAVLYLYFKGTISKESYMQICDMVKYKRYELHLEDSILKLFELVTGEMDNKYDDFEELRKQLNKFKIPSLVVERGDEIFELKDVQLLGQKLYYLLPDDNNCHQLVYIDINSTCPDFTNQDDVCHVGTGFSEIKAVTKSVKKLYLRLMNDNQSYVSVENESDILTYENYHPLGVMGDIPIVVTREGKLAYRLGGNVNDFAPFSKDNIYIFQENRFRVEPNDKGNSFFQPYYLYLDGKTKPCQTQLRRTFMWKELTKDFSNRFSSCEPTVKEQFGNIEEYTPKTLSIKWMSEFLVNVLSDDFRSTNKNYILLETIFQLLSENLDEEQDITELLYLLVEWNKKVSSNAFPSENLYWKVKELKINNNDKFRTAIEKMDLEALRQLGESLDDVNEEDSVEDHSESYIGYFDFNEECVIHGFKIKYMKGKHIGNQILAPINKQVYSSYVVYDFISERFHIHTPKKLTGKEIAKVLDVFNLTNCPYVMAIEKCELVGNDCTIF